MNRAWGMIRLRVAIFSTSVQLRSVRLGPRKQTIPLPISSRSFTSSLLSRLIWLNAPCSSERDQAKESLHHPPPMQLHVADRTRKHLVLVPRHRVNRINPLGVP